MRFLPPFALLALGCATAGSIDDEFDGAVPRDAARPIDAAMIDAAPDAPLPCDQGDINMIDPATGNCYMVFENGTSWNGASGACTALGNGAHLVTIFDAAENTFVRGLRAGELWIGTNDVATEGIFLWVTGERVDGTFDNWDVGEPNNTGGEDCAHMRDNETWNDEDCPDGKRYVCERP